MKTLTLSLILLSSSSYAALGDKQKAALQKMNTQVSGVDAYLDSIAPPLTPEFKALLSKEMKARLVERAREQVVNYVDILLKDLENTQ